MNKNKIFSVSLMAVLLLMAVVSYGAEMAGKCSLCGMNYAGNENTAYEITLQDGKIETYCCPHCGLYAQALATTKIKSARARDFISGEWMDPATITFLFKSSALPACSPSWIAFGKNDEAAKFQKGFGGTIYPFAEALKVRANMPKGMEM